MMASQLEKWRQLAPQWYEQGPPATPSVEDVDIIANMLDRYMVAGRPQLGVLGVTPNIRNMLGRKWPDGKRVIIDFCEEMYSAALAFVDSSVCRGEQYLPIDWNRLGAVAPNRFDAFVGDKSLDNIDMLNWVQFLGSLSHALTQHGIVVLHVGFPDPELAGEPFASIARRWVRALEDGLDARRAAAGLWEDLLSGSASESTGYLSLEPYRHEILGWSRRTGFEGTLASLILQEYAGQLNGRWANFQESDVVAAAAEVGLRILAKEYSHDYHAARYQPILVLG